MTLPPNVTVPVPPVSPPLTGSERSPFFRRLPGPTTRAAFLSLVAGAAAACGFAPLNLWPLTIVALIVPLALVARAPGWRGALAIGWAFGLGIHCVGLNWIAGAFRYQEALPVWSGWAGVVLLSAYLALYPGLAAVVAWLARPQRSAGTGVAGAQAAYLCVWVGAWIASEYARATVFTGFAWNPLAVTLVPTPVDGWARVIGTYGLSGVLIALAGGLWTQARGWAAPYLFAMARGGGWPLTPPLARTPWLATIVQPNIDQAVKNSFAHDDWILRRTLRLTPKGQAKGPPRLIFWPEAASPYPLNLDGVARRWIAARMAPGDVIFAGSDRIVPQPDGAIDAANSLFLIDAHGRILSVYDKSHLVPFGEYVPMPWLLKPLGLARFVPGEGSFLMGPGPRTLALPGFSHASAGVLICYEVIFSGEVVDRAHRPAFLFNPSNDAWFGTWGPPQHFAQARLRAIEEGLPVIRATPTGISGMIGADGSVIAALPLGRMGVIQTEIPAAASPGPFARLGNLIPLCLAGLALGLGFLLGRRLSRIALGDVAR